MKKLLLIALLLIGSSVAFTGCSKKNDDGSPSSGSVSKAKLIGKWLYVKFIEDGYTENFTDGEYFQLNEDGTAYDSMDDDYAQWSLSGSKITFTVEGKSYVATVEKLTGSEFVMSTNDNGEVRTAYFRK